MASVGHATWVMLPLICQLAQTEMTSMLQLPAGNSPQADSQDQPELGLVAGNGSQRICKEGRLYPNVYILGAQKAGTTTLAYALKDAGIDTSAAWMVGEAAYQKKKESEIVALNLADFVNKNMKDRSTLEDFAQKWYGLFPMCSQVPQHVKQLGEFTVRNLEMTDPHFVKDWPAILVAEEELWEPRFALLGFDLPPALRYSYGEAGMHVRFVVSLREPISRRNSALYQWLRKLHFHHNESRARLFDPGAHLLRDLEKLVKGHEFSYGLWHSLYGRHLSEWFHYWKESQFLVFPYKYMTSKVETVCRSMSQHLHTTLNCAKLLQRENSERSHPSIPSIEEQVPKAWLQKAAKALEGELHLLIDVLTKAHSKGLVMPALEVQKGHATSQNVRTWLVNGW